MNKDLQKRVEILREDYRRFSHKPFVHFYCPILHVDEPAELQKGHIINEAFSDSSRAWVVQRKDVDNFFASPFESDFEII